MNEKQHITAFYLEALLMILVFVGTILILTGIFGAGKAQSSEAKMTTNAVCLAENAAEAAAAARSPEELLQLMNETGNAVITPEGLVRACYTTDMAPDPEGNFVVEVTWEPEEAASPGAESAGTLVRNGITVRYEGRGEPVYTLRTAVYLQGVVG